MSEKRSDSLDRPVGELWVELSRDEKKKICEALIDRNKPDVMQEFASLVRFTRGYLQQQPNGSLPPSNGTPSVPAPATRGSQPSDNRVEKRKNEEAPVDKASKATKKAREAAFKTRGGRIVGPPMSESPPSSESDWDDKNIKAAFDDLAPLVLPFTSTPANNQRKH